MRLFVAIAAAAALSGCATAPLVHEVEKTRTIPASKDVVWERAVGFFATNNLSIETIEKDSGIIAAERTVNRPAAGTYMGGWADCGASFLEIPVAQLVDLNVFVRPVGEATSATVNARFTEVRQMGSSPTTTATCNSTGALERMILDALSN